VGVSYYSWGPADITLTGNVIQGNRHRGVLIDGNSSPQNAMTVMHNIITDNTGDNSNGSWTGYAGALHLFNNGPALASNTVFGSNTDPSFNGAGGVLIEVKGALTFSGNQVVGNSG